MPTLNVFRDLILRPLVDERRTGGKTLRIWSAGCCSGEEPYTIAMILTELLHDLPAWDIKIMATDLNPLFLEKAKRGIYTPWSFRDTTKEQTDRYFIKRGSTFEILPTIRKMVTFLPLNLVSEPGHEIANALSSQDVIFCRNVLMYFSTEMAAGVAARFHASLVDNGWFITSPVEVSQPVFGLFTPVVLDGLTMYRKCGPLQTQPQQPPAFVAFPSMPVQHKKAEKPSGNVQKIVKKQPTTPAVKTEVPAGDVINAGSYYIQAAIAQENNLPEAAEQALQKALYLDPSHLLSHFLMGRIAAMLGKEIKSKKHYRNVKELLSAYENEEILPGSEGMTAGRLKEIVNSMK
jgi:chemotaxis protein methyltransferase CheR